MRIGAAAYDEVTAMLTIWAPDHCRTAGQHHTGDALVGHRGHDGGKPLGHPVEHGKEPRHGVSVDAAHIDHTVCVAILAVPTDWLKSDSFCLLTSGS